MTALKPDGFATLHKNPLIHNHHEWVCIKGGIILITPSEQAVCTLPGYGSVPVNILPHETYVKIVEFLEGLVSDGEHGIGMELLEELKK